MITTTLDGQWKLKAVSPMIASGLEKGSEWNMNIPGSLHDTLLAENLIKEPYDGLESEKSRWIGESLWSVERTFNFERSEGPVFFKCGGLSACRININGKTAAEKYDASPLLLDISEYITGGENKIEIFFLPQLDKSISYPGIWRSIKILSDPVLIIAGSEAETENRNGKWLLDVIIPAIAEKDTETEYTISINGKTETGKLSVPKGSGDYLISIDPGEVSQWWPAGIGSQPIYPVTISINGYKAVRNVAFRTWNLLADGLFLNGRKIFMKGAELESLNLIPSRTDYVYIEKITRSAAEANMNAIVLRKYAGRSLQEAALRSGLLVIDAGAASSIPKPVEAPSFPSKETMDRIWKDGKRNIASPEADAHGDGAGKILSSVAASFLFPSDERKLVYLSQIKAAWCATEKAAWNRINGKTGMILSSITDPWPEISASAIEYGGKWKLLQYAARAFFSPLSPLLIDEGKVIGIYLINDTLQEQEAELSVKVRDFSGTKKETREYSVKAGAGTVLKVAEYPVHRLDREKHFLYVKLSTKDVLRERTMLLDKPKNLALENPKLKVSAMKNGPRAFSVKIMAEKPAFYVALSNVENGLFSDNMITVRPSAEKTIFFKAEEDITLEAFEKGLKVMDLYTAMQ